MPSPVPGEAQPFLRGGLHVYPRSGNSYRKGDVCLHLRDEILQLRPLGDHGHVDVAHPITRRSDLFRHVFQKQQGIRTLVLGVGVREMPPDISQPRRAQQGVGNGVEQHIGVGMAVQPLFVVDLHAAQYQVTAFHQPVHVVAMPDPHLGSSSRSSAIFRSRGVVTFRFRSSPSTIFTEKPIRSTAEQSSVSLALSAFALASAPRRISKSNT